MTRYCPRQRRRGFTLLEVLIVVSIVALLASFLVMAIGSSIKQAREAATRTTLLKLDGLLQQRLDAFRVLMDTPQKQNELKAGLSAKQKELVQTYPELRHVMNDKLVQLLIYKEYYRRGFPQRVGDNNFLGNTGQPFAGNVANPAESSEFLFWLVTQADTFGVPAVDDSEFTSAEVADTDGDGRMEFVDAWGQPLRFYRWPTRLLRPTGPAIPPSPLGTNLTWLNVPVTGRNLGSVLMKGLPAAPTLNSGDADPLALDPDDRQGAVLASITRNADMSTATITSVLNRIEILFHTPDTYHIPLIVSGGPDKEIGLYEPNDIANFGNLAAVPAATITDPFNSALNDNLTNRQKQQK
jgi:prepilin-type N-terminal cleavage/methylation domain-containing protein